ncbi:RNA-binding protein [Mucilaginibacter sp. PAMB04168]|uniref:RNA recognition motif domain-containing protein n=1 Tax=Mucilaginibacter sp. PAMB04168 TaxID=3138567 RepID=UPI0031F624DA
MVKLFVGGFPLEMTEMELAQLIGPHGTISTIKIVRDRKTRICKGYAFVEMATEEDARNAVAALHGEPLGERTLTINFADEKKDPVPVSRARLLERRYTPAQPRDSSTTERPKRPRKRL